MRRRFTVRIAMFRLFLTLLLCTAPLAPLECAANTVPAGTEQELFGKLGILSPTGEQIPLVSYIGNRAVVVVFWTTWCPLCRKEVPQLNRLNADASVKIVAVNYRESVAKVRTFMAANDVGYTVAVDLDGTVAQAFQAPGMPYCVILGRSGTVVYRGSMLPENLDYYTGR